MKPVRFRWLRGGAAGCVLAAVSALLGAACEDRTGGDQPMPDAGRPIAPTEGGEPDAQMQPSGDGAADGPDA